MAATDNNKKPHPASEAACADGIDNDGDGAWDCDDRDCQSPGGECTPAPDLDRTVPTTVWESAQYLYSGENPLQKDVSSGVFERQRIAILRGQVVDANGAPLAGATVTIQDHPEYGYTYSRGDGTFDMAVNGGSRLVIEYTLARHLPAQRTVQPNWRSYEVFPDVGLVQPGLNHTTLASHASEPQLVVGDAQASELGAHQPVLIIEPGTDANAQVTDSDERPLSNLTITATEYPISADDRYSPGSSSDSGGLALALNFAVKEAEEIGAEHVTFSKPVSLYVENLGDIPAGTAITVRNYERNDGQWEPGISGQVIQLLAAAGGHADIDADGDGVADSDEHLDSLGITAADRRELARRYPTGQTLWHAELRHFSDIEVKVTGAPPSDAVAPQRRGMATKTLDTPTFHSGMLVEHQASTHGEPILGTPFTLYYQSNRTLAYGAGRLLEVPLLGDDIPKGLKKIRCKIVVAGRTFAQEFSKLTANMVYAATWDGKDAKGRLVQAQQVAEVTIGYVYPDTKTRTTDAELSRTFKVPLGNWDAAAYGLGGFSIDAFHVYDPDQQIVYFGNGTQRSAANVGLATQPASSNDQFDLGTPDSLYALADGSLIVTDDQQGTLNFGRIIKIAQDGTPHVLCGTGAMGRAANVFLTQPAGVVVTSDGRIIVADIYDNRIVELNSDGNTRTLISGNAGETPEIRQVLQHPDGMALGARDELYFVDADKIYRWEAHQLAVIAGGGTDTSDGIAATQARLQTPSGLAINKRSGDVFVSERAGHRVRKITSNGVISTVAGTGTPGFSGDGGPAGSAELSAPHGLALDPNGQLYVVDQGNGRIRRISSDDLIQTVIGGGTEQLNQMSMAVNIKLEAPDGIAAGPDGSLFIAQNKQVIRAFVGIPQVANTDNLVPSRDGRTLYHFDQQGRHLETIDAVTGITQLRFNYDQSGKWLQSIVDVDGKATVVERDGTRLKAIVSPDKLKTSVKLNDSGNAWSITDPINRTTTVTWNDKSLVETVEDPKSRSRRYDYDVNGRLLSMQDPTGYKETLSRSNVTDGWNVTVTTSVPESTSYMVQYAAEAWKRAVIRPDGSTYRSIDAGANLTQVAPDGTKHYVTFTPDNSFGSQALNPYEDILTLPSGKSLRTTRTTLKQLTGNANPLDLKFWEDSSETNGHWSFSRYDRSNRTLKQTSPMGKQRTLTADDRGHARALIAAGLPSIEWVYENGRPASMIQSAEGQTRANIVTYDANGWVDSVTNPLQEKISYTRDNVGRVLEMLAPNSTKTKWSLDDADNVRSITPPGSLAHDFTYDDKSKLLTAVLPPPVDEPIAGDVTFDYANNKLTRINHADGRSIAFAYDAYGRLSTQKLEKATLSFSYTANHLTRISRSDGVTLEQAFDGPVWTASSWSGGVSGDVQAQYDKNLWLSSLTVNGASTVTFKYDDDGNLTAASATAGSVELVRDASTGRISKIALENTSSQQKYSDFGELSQLTVDVSGSRVFEQAILMRDALGRVKHLTEVSQGSAHDMMYEYDSNGRLWKQTRDGVATTYVYDSNGNRTQVQVGADAVAASYDAQDRIKNYGSQVYKHDAHGDLNSRSDLSNHVNLQLSYDELGNLLKAQTRVGADTSPKTIEYMVDGLGRRVARRVNGQFDRKWLYRDALRPVAEVDSAGVFTHFIYDSHSEFGGAPIAMIRSGVPYRIIKDHLGSVRLVVNAQTGDIAQTLEYDAYGRVLNETGAGFQPFGFAGGLYDPDTQLVRFGARDYDPEIGRWTNRDPIGFAGQQTNQYLYVGGDPVNTVDPNGEIANVLAGAIMGAATDIAWQYLQDPKRPIDWREVIVASVFGGISGGLSVYTNSAKLTAGAIMGRSLLLGSGTGAGQYTTMQYLDDRPITAQGLWYSAVLGGIGGMTSAVMPQLFKAAPRSRGLQYVERSAIAGAVDSTIATGLNQCVYASKTAFFIDTGFQLSGNLIGNAPVPEQ